MFPKLILNKEIDKEKASGIFLPIFSLPSKYGIGSFSKEAYKFLHILNSIHVKYWEILPLNDINSDNFYNPYSTHSAFAGNPLFIDLDVFVEYKWIKENDINSLSYADNENSINYQLLFKNKYKILHIAYGNSNIKNSVKFGKFIKENEWLENYALYMSIKGFLGNKPWYNWEEKLKKKDKTTIIEMKEMLNDDILFFEFLQFEFHEQWFSLKKYANNLGIKIIGGLQFYLLYDSVDLWTNSEYFILDENLNPLSVAGNPPDSFSPSGQLWGNPLYNWKKMKETDYNWWINRFIHSFNLYDIIHIKYFRDFETFYAIPSGSIDASTGHWENGPGYELFEKLNQKLTIKNIIIDNEGLLTPKLKELINLMGWSKTSVFQYDFYKNKKNQNLTNNYDYNCIAYTGAYDNDSILGWYKNLDGDNLKLLNKFLNIKTLNEVDLNWKCIESIYNSNAKIVIIRLQDYLGVGSESMVNIPEIKEKNWKWRMKKDSFTISIQNKIKKLNLNYGR